MAHVTPFDQVRVESTTDKTGGWHLALQGHPLRRRSARVGHGHASAPARTPACHGQTRSPQAQYQNVLVFKIVHHASAGPPQGGIAPFGGQGSGVAANPGMSDSEERMGVNILISVSKWTSPPGTG